MAAPARPSARADAARHLHIDVTVCWDRRGAPVGMSRVVAELARAVREADPASRAWRYDHGRRQLVEVSWTEVARTTAPASPAPTVASGMRALIRRLPYARDARAALLAGRRLLLARRWSRRLTVAIAPGDRFVLAETIGEEARLAACRALLDTTGASPVFYCHDVIPALFPDLVEPATARCFPVLLATFAHADARLLANSAATARDLMALLGRERRPGDVAVVPPGTDLPPSLARDAAPGASYILYVSTVEARKNHAVLLDAYDRLIAAGRIDLPRLVFVGRRGWLVDPLLRAIDRGTGAAAHVRLMERVADADLATLYRGARFTVYPSRYEGWGMPVSEALALGRFCLCADRGGLPEAGAGLVELLDPDDPALWADRIAWYLDHPAALRDREATIARHYRPPTWAAFRTAAAAAALADA